MQAVSSSLTLFQSTPSVGRETYNALWVILHAFRFQSTPSVGRETRYEGKKMPWDIISIHSLRGEGDAFGSWVYLIGSCISIHSLRGEGDARKQYYNVCVDDFNPLPPWGGRRVVDQVGSYFGAISIHSLRGEGDQYC